MRRLATAHVRCGMPVNELFAENRDLGVSREPGRQEEAAGARRSIGEEGPH